MSDNLQGKIREGIDEFERLKKMGAPTPKHLSEKIVEEVDSHEHRRHFPDWLQHVLGKLDSSRIKITIEQMPDAHKSNQAPATPQTPLVTKTSQPLPVMTKQLESTGEKEVRRNKTPRTPEELFWSLYKGPSQDVINATAKASAERLIREKLEKEEDQKMAQQLEQETADSQKPKTKWGRVVVCVIIVVTCVATLPKFLSFGKPVKEVPVQVIPITKNKFTIPSEPVPHMVLTGGSEGVARNCYPYNSGDGAIRLRPGQCAENGRKTDPTQPDLVFTIPEGDVVVELESDGPCTLVEGFQKFPCGAKPRQKLDIGNRANFIMKIIVHDPATKVRVIVGLNTST